MFLPLTPQATVATALNPVASAALALANLASAAVANAVRANLVAVAATTAVLEVVAVTAVGEVEHPPAVVALVMVAGPMTFPVATAESASLVVTVVATVCCLLHQIRPYRCHWVRQPLQQDCEVVHSSPHIQGVPCGRRCTGRPSGC